MAAVAGPPSPSSLEFDVKMLEDFLFDFPSSFKVFFDDESISGLDGKRLASVGSNNDLSLNHMNVFPRGVGGVVGTDRCRPISTKRFIRSIFNPGRHRRLSLHFFPPVEVCFDGSRHFLGKGDKSTSHCVAGCCLLLERLILITVYGKYATIHHEGKITSYGPEQIFQSSVPFLGRKSGKIQKPKLDADPKSKCCVIALANPLHKEAAVLFHNARTYGHTQSTVWISAPYTV
jgi:hypothetical protein